MSSSSTAYAAASDLIKFHDARRIGDLVSDSDTRATSASLSSNTTIAAVLLRASGEVEMAAQRGGKYTPADLNALTGAAQEALVGIVCDLARWHLEKRRTPSAQKKDVPGAEDAYATLKQLADGELIFPTDDALDAVGVDVAENTAGGCSTGTCQDRYGRTVNAMRPFFGHRGGDCC